MSMVKSCPLKPKNIVLFQRIDISATSDVPLFETLLTGTGGVDNNGRFVSTDEPGDAPHTNNGRPKPDRAALLLIKDRARSPPL